MKPTVFLGLLAAGLACAREAPVQPPTDDTAAVQTSKTAAPGYELIDLGTLGGASATALALNDAGHVVGWSSTADNARHAFLWENGAMRDLGTGDGRSEAQRITADGVILGTAERFGGPGGQECVSGSLFKWDNGVRTSMGNTSCSDGSLASVVGMTGRGGVVGVVASGERLHSFVWEGGVPRTLGGLNPRWGSALALAMNKHDQIVGSSQVDVQAGFYIVHPFIWEDGVMRDLGILAEFPCEENPAKNCGKGEAFDINSQGEVAGTSNDHAVVWTREGIIDLGGTGGFEDSRANDINDHGEAVGQIGLEAFTWRKGVLTRLPSLGGGSAAVAVNEHGVIAGFSTTPTGEQHAVVWQDGVPLDLGTGPGTGAAARAINEHGDVLGISGSRAILWRRIRPNEVAQQ